MRRAQAAKRDRQLASLEVAGGGPGLPAVAGSGLADECTDGDEGGGEVEEEVHDLAVAVGAAAQLAIAVHPGVRTLGDPSFALYGVNTRRISSDLGFG
jgi:hypothetical protein